MPNKRRGALGYLFMIAAFILLTLIVSDNMFASNTRITYPELLDKIKAGTVERVSIRGSSLYGRSRPSTIQLSDFPTKYDFETTIGPDFLDTVRTMYANKNGVSLDSVSVSDLDFKINYLAPLQTPWYLELLPFLLPVGIMILFWYLMMRQQGGGGGKG